MPFTPNKAPPLATPPGESNAGNCSDASAGMLIYRQNLITRATHWIWAVCLFFLLLSGLQIFNAHPALYVGKQSGFDFDNSVFSLSADGTIADPRGMTTLFGHRFGTTGVLGLSYKDGLPVVRGFPAWATIPSHQDLATGRVVHLFFAWVLVFTLLAWFIGSAINRHLQRDILPSRRDIFQLPRDILDHLRLRLHYTNDYNTLQRLSYAFVMLFLLPLMIVTGLCMSPGINAFAPWLTDIFGGRQTARTIHFAVMTLLVLFFVVHIIMVIVAGPINEMRSIITGWYRTGRSIKAPSRAGE